LVQRDFATDYASTRGALGPIFVVLPQTKLPVGGLQNFQVWNQGTSAVPSAGNVFPAYVLRPTSGVPNGYRVVYDSGLLTMPALTVPGVSEVATFPVSAAVNVHVGDANAYYGEGIPFSYITGPADTTSSYPAPSAPALSNTMTLCVDFGFPILPVTQLHSFAATAAPPA